MPTRKPTLLYSMEDHGAKENSKGVKSIISSCSNYLWGRLATLLPSSHSKLHRQTARRHRRCSACLPLPIPSCLPESTRSREVNKSSRICHILEDMIDQILLKLRIVEKSLHFWQSRERDSDPKKLYRVICERGPVAFVDGIARLFRESLFNDHPKQTISGYASSYIPVRVAILSILRRSLATFLAEVYMEVERCGQQLASNPKSSSLLLSTSFNRLFSDLEKSIGRIHYQYDSSVDESFSMRLIFEKLPEPNQEDSNLTDSEVAYAVYLVYKNLEKLDSYFSLIVSKTQKPRKVTQYWIPYTCGAIGLSVCSMWLINNWTCEEKDSTFSFYEPLVVALREQFLDTFWRKPKVLQKFERAISTANAFERLLLAIIEVTEDIKFPKNASHEEKLEIVKASYEKEPMDPVQNLPSQELLRALDIQAEELKLDFPRAILEPDQMTMENKMNCALLAGSVVYFLSCIWTGFKRRRDRNRLCQSMLYLTRVEIALAHSERIIQPPYFQIEASESHYKFGMILYNLDGLSHVVEEHAKRTGEWQRFMEAVIEVATPGLGPYDKLKLTSRMFDFKCMGYDGGIKTD